MDYGKLINGKLVHAPNVLNKDGKQYINPPAALYAENGYLPLEYTTIPAVEPGYHLVQSWSYQGDKLVQAWNYETDDYVSVLKDKNDMLQEEIERLVRRLNQLESHALVNSDDAAAGDYLNPIFLPAGGLVTIKDRWYYLDNKDVPHKALHEAFATPNNFYDTMWFSVV